MARTWGSTIGLAISFGLGVLFAVVAIAIAGLVWYLNREVSVHVLDAPMRLAADQMGDQLHLLPKGTTLYYDKGFDEGFTRYKVYINIDRHPMKLSALPDPTMVAPIWAHPLEPDELKDALRDGPLTKKDLDVPDQAR